MDIKSIEKIESIGRIIQQVKAHRKAQKVGKLEITRSQYLKQHLSPKDWLFWQQLMKEYFVN